MPTVGISLAAALVFASSCAVPGEDGDEWSASDPASSAGPDIRLGVTRDDRLAEDLTPASPWRRGVDAGVDAAAKTGDVAVATSALSSSGAPLVIYLAYADGKTTQKTSPDPCPTVAPKFVCQFASTLQACQQQIQTYLDRWYADFNVVFTLTRPTSGAYYTEVISTGGGAWCNAKESVGGIAPFLCNDLDGGVAYTFAGGRTAKETAVIIAQEQAHLVGLEHTASGRDIMYPTICTECDAFENTANKVQGDVCGRAQQNSYQMMLDRLGPWTGGVKPTPFGCQADTSSPSVKILEPIDGAKVSSTFVVRAQASDDCKVAKVNIRVSPLGLESTTTAPPFEWTLTRIVGRQVITISVTDPSNKTSTTSITVNAPGSSASGSGGQSGSGGTAGRTGSTGQSDAGAATGRDADDGAIGGGDAGAGLPLDAALSAHTRDAAGCSCRAASSSRGQGGPMSILLGPFGLGLVWTRSRRRRRLRAPSPSCRPLP